MPGAICAADFRHQQWLQNGIYFAWMPTVTTGTALHMDILFYEKPGCQTNARQKTALSAAGHTVSVRSILAEPWTREELRSFFAGMAVTDWFNPAAPGVKSGAVVPGQCDAETALTLMLAQPLLIRRPLMQAGDRRMAGFDPQRVTDFVGAPLMAAGPLDGCSHSGG